MIHFQNLKAKFKCLIRFFFYIAHDCVININDRELQTPYQ